MMRIHLAVILIATASHLHHVAAEPPLYPVKTTPERAAELRSDSWIDLIAREIPPLKNEVNGRMPMIMWHGVGFRPLSKDQLQILRERGLCQHLQLSETMIPAARQLVAAGLPVILMEGRTDSWPYSLQENYEGGISDWAHDFDVTYQPPWFGNEASSQWHGACPKQTAGWKVLSRELKRVLTKFRDAGIKVDAVWVDYEGDPYPWTHLHEQLKHCKRCRRDLPAEIIHDQAAWRDFAWKAYVELYDQYLARAVREVFPEASVTNWHVVFSSRERPIQYFARDVKLPALRPRHFNATNPIAYGADVAWHDQWDHSVELTQANVDQFYWDQMLHQVKADQANRISAGAQDVLSVPWVARVCKLADPGLSPAPVMSRDRYRACLAEIWKTQVHTMQIFNAMHEGYEELALTELKDAVAAYDQMLAETVAIEQPSQHGK